ncbi:MAG: glycosyltransferase family 39 protein, partial [Rudaea sp.]
VRLTGTLVLAVLFVLTLPLLTPRVAASDEIEYFSYLHSIVFDHDLDFRDEYQHFCDLNPPDCTASRFRETFLDQQTPTGLQINFGPIGSALLWLPFYLFAHPVALGLHALNPAIPADGYSLPYIYAISFSSLLYGWLGIILSYRLAREFVGEKIALGAALVVLFASNAVYYLYVAPAMSHANSLFASALFVFIWYFTRASRGRGEWKPWVLLGLSGALMTMVREQEAIFVLLPLVEQAALLTGITSPGSAHDAGRPPARRAAAAVTGLGAMGLAWFVAFVPQLVVYRVLNGNFLPARDVTQKFTWDGAHILDVLFSNFHGLFSWTPVTLLAVLGLVYLWRRDRVVALAFIITFAAEVYLLGSFSTWFGGAAFGMRRFVNCTVLFIVGLALLADAARRRIPLAFLAAGGLLLVVWNLFFIVQFATGLIDRQRPVDFGKLAYNQLLVVPERLAAIAWRFITARGSFYKK